MLSRNGVALLVAAKHHRVCGSREGVVLILILNMQFGKLEF